jgi:hypothetical protein
MHETRDDARDHGAAPDVSRSRCPGELPARAVDGPASRANGGLRWNALVAAGALLVAALSSCVTYIRPVECQGDRRFRCNEHHDIKYCEYEALDVAGPDCDGLGIATSRHFCVVDTGTCVRTHFAVKDRRCDVISHRNLGQWSECPSGVPTFEDP